MSVNEQRVADVLVDNELALLLRQVLKVAQNKDAPAARRCGRLDYPDVLGRLLVST